jgi:hypothetical protein
LSIRNDEGKLKLRYIIVPASLALVVALWVLVFGFWQDNTSLQWKDFTRGFLQKGFFPSLNPIHWTWVAWLFAGIIGAVLSGFLLYAFKDDPTHAKITKFCKGWLAASIIAFLAAWVVVMPFNINDKSASYAGGTEFIVEDTSNPPGSLTRLTETTEPDGNGCDLGSWNDMPGCINEGAYNYTWEPRVASATGAKIAMINSGGGIPNTSIWESTLTYVYSKSGGEDHWTVIRNGSKSTPLHSVVEWNGKREIHVCRFTGPNAIDEAFDGHWGHNLRDTLAKKYTDLFFEDSDMYGFCDGAKRDKPVIVIPVTEIEPFRTRWTSRAAGVIVITGSPEGKPVITHDREVKTGEYPGPVYPASLAKTQREQIDYIAGKWSNWQYSFGYQTTTASSQVGNEGEYQLRDKKTKRIYWVTPLKVRESTDQILVAYSVISADEVPAVDDPKLSLNRHKLYVLPDMDVRAVNLERLETRVRSAIGDKDPAFFNTGGNVVEFLPLDAKTWQVYAEIRGWVKYRVTINANEGLEPEVVTLAQNPGADGTGQTTTPTSDQSANPTAQPTGGSTVNPTTAPGQPSACKPDLNGLSNEELAKCNSDLNDEVNERLRKK